MNVSRREFLLKTGWICVGLTVVGTSGCALVPALPTFNESDDADALTWVQMLPDGRVRFLLPRAEMGQGIATGLTQLVAEELSLPMENIDCVAQSTAAMASCRMTVGSQSVEDYSLLVARAAARLREALAERAAAILEVEVGALDIIPSGFFSPNGQTIHFKQLVEMQDIVVQNTEHTPTLLSDLPVDQRRVVGKAVPAIDLERIVRGQETFSRDVRLPGMLFGAIARPPQIGVKLLDFDRDSALRLEGVVKVVEHDKQVGVIAHTPSQAAKAVEALATQWTRLESDELATVQRGVDVVRDMSEGLLDHSLVEKGSIASGRKVSVQDFTMRFDSPMVAHAALEPRSGVARWLKNAEGKRVCEIHTGSQDPWLVRAAAAKSLGVGKSRIVVHNHRIGGAFGGRVLCQASVEAAWLSRAVDYPVKVEWSREDEFSHNYAGPPYSSQIDAGIDKEGRIAYWQHHAVGAPILTSSTIVPSYLHWAANLVADPGTMRGMAGPYTIANHKVCFGDVRLPMPTGPWRGLGAAPNAFALESAMDELAEAADIDPISFRLNHLDEPRLSHCLERLSALVTNDNSALGVAASAYKGVTFVAVAARVVANDGRLLVTDMYCVHDCGRMLSPDQVRAQIEGCMAWGVGMALHEELVLKDGAIETCDFTRYPLARQSHVPEVVIDMVESDLPPSGAGEAAFVPVAAAIANAVYAATGRRHRQLPITSI